MAQAAARALETPQYTGEIVTFDFRNLDLQDFFRLIGDISGLNVVLDPAVNGTVTLLLRDVPWDQALDLVLRNNSLGYELQGNILRVATQATLQGRRDRDARTARSAGAECRACDTDLHIELHAIGYGVWRHPGPVVGARHYHYGRTPKCPDCHRYPQASLNVWNLWFRSSTRLRSRSKSRPVCFQQANRFPEILATRSAFWSGTTARNAVTGLPGSGSPFARTPAPSVNVGGGVPLISDFPAGGTSGLSFLLGAGGDILLDTIIQAAEAKGTAKLLSRPRITTQNNQPATVSQGTQIPVQTNVNNTISVTFVDFSLSLTVTPQITEAGTILLTAAIENSSSEFGRSVNGIPSVSSQQATTQVLIPDGGTAVIGGILLDNESINVSQVPGLGNIPVLGNLFKSTQVIKSTSELLFFITARIKPANPLEFLSETAAEESSQLFAQ